MHHIFLIPREPQVLTEVKHLLSTSLGLTLHSNISSRFGCFVISLEFYISNYIQLSFLEEKCCHLMGGFCLWENFSPDNFSPQQFSLIQFLSWLFLSVTLFHATFSHKDFFSLQLFSQQYFTNGTMSHSIISSL